MNVFPYLLLPYLPSRWCIHTVQGDDFPKRRLRQLLIRCYEGTVRCARGATPESDGLLAMPTDVDHAHALVPY